MVHSLASLRRVAVAVLVICSAMALSSCGYSLAGRGSFLPDYIRTIGIPTFTNVTAYFDVEQLLTEKVRSEFIGRGKYKVVPNDTGVDALLKGEITGISIQPATFNNQQQASRYVFVLSAKIEFRDVKTDKILWETGSLSFREEYELATGSGPLDPRAFFGQQSNAVERVATDFGKSVVSSILEAF